MFAWSGLPLNAQFIDLHLEKLLGIIYRQGHVYSIQDKTNRFHPDFILLMDNNLIEINDVGT